MLKYKIIKSKFSWQIVIPDQACDIDEWGGTPPGKYPKLVRTIINTINRNQLPYIKKCEYHTVWGTAITGGPYIFITLSPLMEDEDLDELKGIIDSIFSDNLFIVTRHKTKLTTFIPTSLRWSL